MKAKVEKALGHSGMEIAGLAAGGALVSGIPSLVAKLVNMVAPTQLATVQKFYLDSIAAPAAIGALLNVYAKDEKLKALGKGIIGATVVKASIVATHYVESKVFAPSASTLKGFVPGPSMGTARLLKRGGGDFGNVATMKKSRADFGEYTPPPTDFAGAFLDSDMASEDEQNAQMG